MSGPANVTFEGFVAWEYDTAMEGWRVAYHGEGEFLIEREDMPDQGAIIFRNDHEAWDFVVSRALAGSEMHKKALAIVTNRERALIAKRVGALTLAAAMQTTTTVGET